MAQPKQPPLSIRPGEARLALIDAHAARHGLTRHAAVLDMIDRGLSPPKAKAPPIERATRDLEPPVSRNLQLGPIHAKPGDRLKKSGKA